MAFYMILENVIREETKIKGGDKVPIRTLSEDMVGNEEIADVESNNDEEDGEYDSESEPQASTPTHGSATDDTRIRVEEMPISNP